MIYKLEKYKVIKVLESILEIVSLNTKGWSISTTLKPLTQTSTLLNSMEDTFISKDSIYYFIIPLLLDNISNLYDKSKLYISLLIYLYKYKDSITNWEFNVETSSSLRRLNGGDLYNFINESNDKDIYNQYLKDIPRDSFIQFIEDKELKVKIIKGSYISGETGNTNLMGVYVLVSYSELKDYKGLYPLCEYIKSVNKCLLIISPGISNEVKDLFDKNLKGVWTYIKNQENYDLYKDYAAICGSVLIDLHNEVSIKPYHLGYIEELSCKSSYSIIKPSSNGNITTINRLNDLDNSNESLKRRANILGQLVFLYGNSSIMEYRIVNDLICLLNKSKSNLYILDNEVVIKDKDIDWCIQKAIKFLSITNKEAYNLIVDRDEMDIIVKKAISLTNMLDSIEFVIKK
jgi:hypothetical protein